MRAIENAGCKILCIVTIASVIISCKKQGTPEGISQALKEKIIALGFSASNLQQLDEGYLTEGDIVLPDSVLNTKPQTQFLRIAGNEQYRTFNIITALPRTLTISLSAQFPATYGAALDEAIRRYNEENLQLHFQRANSDADINILKGYGNFIAVSGLPLRNGAPYQTIKLNAGFIGDGNTGKTFVNYLASLITHEIGHCIGFRHTDYMNRSFSCRGRPVNEGAGNSGAVNIPGTPVRADASSWMLACITVNENRLFNDNDKTALNYLY